MKPLVLSFDLELRWGLQDVLGPGPTPTDRVLPRVPEVVHGLLEAFSARGVRATWAAVGALACETWDEYEDRAPPPPAYREAGLRLTFEPRRIDPEGAVHLAPGLLAAVARSEGQDLGHHTFSHVCLGEDGVTELDATRDADAVHAVFSARFGAAPQSMVFPRNQARHPEPYRRRGVRSFRPARRGWPHDRVLGREQSSLVRGVRLVEAIVAVPAVVQDEPIPLFVRVGLPALAWDQHRRALVHVARRNPGGAHLWLHPHNLAWFPQRDVPRLLDLLDELMEGGDFASQNMADAHAPAARRRTPASASMRD